MRELLFLLEQKGYADDHSQAGTFRGSYMEKMVWENSLTMFVLGSLL